MLINLRSRPLHAGKRRVILVCLALLMLTGCGFFYQLETTIKPDGSGSQQFVSAVINSSIKNEAEWQAGIAKKKQYYAAMPGVQNITDWSNDRYKGIQITAAFSDLPTFETQVKSMFLDGNDSVEALHIDSIKATTVGDQFTLDLALAGTLNEEQSKQLNQDDILTWTLNLPTVSKLTAGDYVMQRGNTVVFDFKKLLVAQRGAYAEQVAIQGSLQPSARPFPWLWLFVGIAVVSAVLAGVFKARRTRKSAQRI